MATCFCCWDSLFSCWNLYCFFLQQKMFAFFPPLGKSLFNRLKCWKSPFVFLFPLPSSWSIYLKLNFFFEKKPWWKPSWRKGAEKKVQKTKFLKKKTLRDGGNQRKKPSETVEVKEKGSRRRWKSKNFGELLINQVFEKKKVKKTKFFWKKSSQRRWKSKKKALGDGGSQKIFGSCL